MADPEDAGADAEGADEAAARQAASDGEDAPAAGEGERRKQAPVDEAPTEEAPAEERPAEEAPAEETPTREQLRERVEQEYDFEDFGPGDMVEMSAEEWEVAFDDEAWVTGEELLDRLEADLRARVAQREVFAVVERAVKPPRLVAYSDEGYAVVGADGSVEGRGTVLRDVKPSVALVSMPEYEVSEPPEGGALPAPEEVPEADGGVGNTVLQVVAGALLLCGLVLLGAPLFADLGGAAIIAVVAGIVFAVTALFLGLVVANARLSARFRAEEYRDRLRAAGVAEGERPDFLPVEDHEFENERASDRQPADGGDDHAFEG